MAKPAIQWGVLNIVNQNAIVDRAQTLKDGLFSFRGIIFRVCNGKATHFATRGEIVAGIGHFNTVVGHYANDQEAKRLLKNIKG